MAIPVSNFGLVTVSGGYLAGATTITLQTGDGSKLPATTGGFRYPLTWWNATDYAHPADDPAVEIILVTDRTGNTLTVLRGQEGTGAANKNTSGKTYRMSLGQTAAMWNDLRLARSTHQGLVLQTHRDAASAKSKVELVTCDYVVMDDGTVLRNDAGEWSGQTADMTVSGAGGLDAGTEEAVDWYEIHAIAKEDGTRALLLHQSKRWTVDEFNTSGEDASQSVRASSGNMEIAQGFQPNYVSPMLYVDVKMKKVGTPTGMITAAIYSNNAGVPGGVLATSYALDVSRLPTSVGGVRFVFPPGSASLSASTQYHIVLSGTWTIDGVNYVEWRMDGSAGTYAHGAKATYNGTTWTTDTDDDMIFTTYVERLNTGLVLPAEYTKSCLLGWVKNDPFGDFVPFVQHGRTRRTAILDANSYAVALDGTLQVKQFIDFLPPLEMCSALIGVSGTGTQAAVVAVGDVRATDLTSVGDTVGAQAVLYSGITSTKPGGFAEVLVERGGAMFHGTPGGKVWVVGCSW